MTTHDRHLRLERLLKDSRVLAAASLTISNDVQKLQRHVALLRQRSHDLANKVQPQAK